MADQVTRLRIFVASPGDVQAEREALDGVVDELQRTLGQDRPLFLDYVRYETHAAPAMGDVQAVITEQLDLKDIDLFVGILWKRFGTPTPRAGSGTEDEFQIACAP